MKAHSLLLLVLIIAAGVARAQDAPQATLQSDRVYTAVITRTLSGNDGVQEITPSVSEQRITITTGGKRDGAMLVEVNASLPLKNGAEAASAGTTYSFTLGDDGGIRDVKTSNSEFESGSDLAFGMLSRTLESALFRTAYALKGTPGQTVRVTTVRPEAKGQSVEYVVDDSRAEAAAGQQPVPTLITGSAVFDAASSCYVHRMQSEETRILVAADEKNAAKQVVMRREVKVDVRMSPLTH